jgi:hypothetical protein
VVVKEEPIAAARGIVAEMFPHARWALLAGSALTPHRTPGSDLDIVVLLPDGDPAAPHRRSCYRYGWPVELFVHDDTTLDHYLAKDLPHRRPVMHRMIATGVVVAGASTQSASLQQRCEEVLAAGPPPLTEEQRAAARYQLTDLLDDLTYAEDAGERLAVAATAWMLPAQQALAFAGHWSGAGKWLLRELRAMDSALATRWVAAHGDAQAIAAFVQQVLERAGGRLFAGYEARGDRPATVAVRRDHGDLRGL